MADEAGWWESLLREFELRKGAGWAVQELLGQGNSAAVFSVETPNGLSALKIYKPEFLSGANEAAERFRLSLHERLRGHNCDSLVKIIEVGDLDVSAYVLMEHVPWRSLDTMLGAVDPVAIPRIIADVAKAAIWLETNGLVHRDIKPANILIAPDFTAAKLVDLGVIRDVEPGAPDLTDQGARRPFVATAQYSSPEYLFRLTEPSERLWKGLSLYQVGAVLHDLVVGKPLFQEEVQSENRYVLAMAVYRKSPPIKAGNFPAAWGAIAKRSLTKDLDARLASVDWNDFLALDEFDVNSARKQLGLLSQQEDGVLVQRENVRARRVLLGRQLTSSLRDAVDAGMRKEGYKRIRWINQDDHSVWIRINVPSDISKSLEFRIKLDIGDALIRVLEAACIVTTESAVHCDARRLLWAGGLESFSTDMSEDLLPLILETLLRRLFDANNLVTLGIDSSQMPCDLGGG